MMSTSATKHALAIFDLDHTLLAGDSNVIWTDYLFEQGLINADFITLRDKIAQAYQRGEIDFASGLSKLLLPLGWHPRAELTKHRDLSFAKHVAPKLYPQGKALIKQHLDAGDTVIIISATNEFLIEKVGEATCVHDVIGVQLETDEVGEFTGGYIGTPSFGAGKQVRLEQWLKAHDMTLDDFSASYFYTDSINDAPLLHAVSQPIVVNPDEKLAQLAKHQGWKRLTFCMDA